MKINKAKSKGVLTETDLLAIKGLFEEHFNRSFMKEDLSFEKKLEMIIEWAKKVGKKIGIELNM